MEPLAPEDPQRVGRYRLGGRLGAGGMGEVYWGRSASGRPVAVKVVHRHLASQPEFRQRFAQEVDAARRVGGFHTASVVDADPEGNPPWLVTAYVAGPSLDVALARYGPFALSTLRTLGAGLAEAIEAVHAAGLVHRDLKPSNILLTEDGPRVIDFGIARALDGGGGLTATGSSIGTPRFMAPEQFGDGQVTGAADVFALGTVLCHAAGAHPFGEGTAATIAAAILTRQPVLTAVPPQLVGLIGRCLDKDPERRPTPAQLLDELSDGSASAGWLPPPVQAMLAEHTLPDLPSAQVAPTRIQPTPSARQPPAQQPPAQQPPAQQPSAQQPQGPRYPGPPPPDQATEVQATQRHPAQQSYPMAGGPAPTQRYSGPPQYGPPQYEQPPAAQEPPRRRPVVAIVVAAVATVAIVGGVVAAIALSSGTSRSSVAAPASTTASAAAGGEATQAPGSSSAPYGTGWVGNWQSVEGSARNIAVSIDHGEEGGSIYDFSITVVEDPACGGGNSTSTARGSSSGNEMSTSFVLACDGSTGAPGQLDVKYTLGGEELTDDKGTQYRRI